MQTPKGQDRRSLPRSAAINNRELSNGTSDSSTLRRPRRLDRQRRKRKRSQRAVAPPSEQLNEPRNCIYLPRQRSAYLERMNIAADENDRSLTWGRTHAHIRFHSVVQAVMFDDSTQQGAFAPLSNGCSFPPNLSDMASVSHQRRPTAGNSARFLIFPC